MTDKLTISNLFEKDISRKINGVVKAEQTDNDVVFTELDEYVVTKEMAAHFNSFFEYYMPSVDDPDSKAATGKLGIWISGFFGSGKSHFIKITNYIMNNTEASKDGISKKALEFFEEKIDDSLLLADMARAVSKDNTVMLFNIDSRASTNDGDDAILKVFMKVFNEQLGFSGDYPHIAHIERILSKRGVYEMFKSEFFELAEAEWETERETYHLYEYEMSEALSKAIGQTVDAARNWVEKCESEFVLDVKNFCTWVKEYLDVSQERRVLFFIDEIGQFIGNNTQMMLKLQTLTESFGAICGGRAWIIVTSQAEIDKVVGGMEGTKANDFSKIQGRFEKIALSSSNTNEVIEKRLLLKKKEVEPVLTALFEQKGDIIRNQLAFDKTTTAEFANYDNAETFVKSYPFAPYHYVLVQKIFEAIRTAGATGQHLSRGERSLLDAFQHAAELFGDEEVGKLIPLYNFYPSIESFLDVAVKRDIDQAGDLSSIDGFSLNILKTLFLIRYVDSIKSTLDNLVTLCVTQVDEDRVLLRRNIEKALNPLEQNLLITLQGDEYIFLTNEEKEIEREIKNVEVELSEENNELNKLIYDDILRRNKSYRYPVNSQDFPISRYCNGAPHEGAQDTDIVVKILSPVDPSYADYNEGACANLSADGEGTIIIKLADDKHLFKELRSFIRTTKYTKSARGSRDEQARLLSDKSAENHKRKERLKVELERLLKDADFFALGSKLDPKGSAITSILDECYRYVIENTFGKLKLITPFSGDIRREIQGVLAADDVGQLGLDLKSESVNPEAVIEVERYLTISDNNDRVVYAEDLIKKFSRRPYGWATDEILLITARMAVASKFKFEMRQQEVNLKSAYDLLTQVRKRAEMRVRIVKQQSDANLKQATKLFKETFYAQAPDSEKEFFNEAKLHLSALQSKLQNYKSKSETGKYPGKSEIEDGLSITARLLEVRSSYEFIDRFISLRIELTEFSEDFQDLENFYENQFDGWKELANALNNTFERNRSALERIPEARDALSRLWSIYSEERPYGVLHEIAPNTKVLSDINAQLLAEKRNEATKQIQSFIDDISEQIKLAHVPSDLSNRVLRPLQLCKQRLDSLIGIADINQEVAEAEALETDAFSKINDFIEQSQKQPVTPSPDIPATTGGANSPSVPAPVAPPTAKKVISTTASELTRRSGQSGVIETAEDVNAYVDALKSELMVLVDQNTKVRLK
jgi:hypothetical protein